MPGDHYIEAPAAAIGHTPGVHCAVCSQVCSVQYVVVSVQCARACVLCNVYGSVVNLAVVHILYPER